jgi:hypothetical protein
LQSPAICSVGGPVAAIDPQPGAPFAERWERYRAHRFAIDSVFGALELQSGVSSWPGQQGSAPGVGGRRSRLRSPSFVCALSRGDR